MQHAKSFIVGLCILAAFLCLFTVFIPSHVTIMRALEINAPSDSIQAHLNNLEEWPAWNTWMGEDSVVTREYTKATPGKEASVTWFAKGQPATRNFIAILQEIPGEIRLHYQFKKMLPASGGFVLTANGKGQTFVQWKLEAKLRWYPWEKINGIAMDKVWGASMDVSLQKFKERMETGK